MTRQQERTADAIKRYIERQYVGPHAAEGYVLKEWTVTDMPVTVGERTIERVEVFAVVDKPGGGGGLGCSLQIFIGARGGCTAYMPKTGATVTGFLASLGTYRWLI